MEVSEYCEKHKSKKEIKEVMDSKFYICFECAKEAEAEVKKVREEMEIKKKQARINNRLDNAMILPRFQDKTLDNFQAVSKDQKKVLDIARWFVENIDTATGLIFLGKPGTGKNHLSAGIVKEIIENHSKTALITEAIKIVRSIKETWKGSDIEESSVIKSYLEPDLLVIDELGIQFGSDTEKMYLSEVINDRYNHMKATILLGNLTKDELTETIGDRVLDRFREGGKMFIFDWESHRGK